MSPAELKRLTEEDARAYLERMRWPNGIACVFCGNTAVTRLQGKATRPGVLKCKGCRKQFTVTVKSIMERSHIALADWVRAFHKMCASKKGISALQLARELAISYESAWFLCHRIRLAMKKDPLAGMLSGVVEVDETYVGGKSRKGRRGRGSERKTPVFAAIQRDGRMHAQPVARVNGDTLKPIIRHLVDRKARVCSDEFGAYRGLNREFKGGHRVVNHGEGVYSFRGVHVNHCESFFALLKRGVHGVFHHVSKKHLSRYCDEFSFRWDNRKVTDSERADAAVKGAEGKRLLYLEPIGDGR